jgi:uncharacterized protein YggT (Ycf19 family)
MPTIDGHDDIVGTDDPRTTTDIPVVAGEDDDETRFELFNDQTIELLLFAAKILIVIVYVVVLMTFAILSLGFLLHLAGASPEATFVEWAYRNTERAMQPFRGMFPVQGIDDRSVFDPSLLFAAALYGFLAIGLHAVLEYLAVRLRSYQRRVARGRAAGTTQREPNA